MNLRSIFAAIVLLSVLLVPQEVFCRQAGPAGCEKDKTWNCQIDEKTCCDKEKHEDCADRLDCILKTLASKTAGLISYEADIKYLFVQDPEMLDARTLRTGKLYYLKEENSNKMRINFETISYDDGEQQEHKEQYILENGWLIKIDYQLKEVQYNQLAPEDKAFDAFAFISQQFPLVGFIETNKLRKEFEIRLIEPKETDPNNLFHLSMTPQQGSKYKDKYTKIDFWLCKRLFLPVRTMAWSNENDIYDIQLLEPKANKKIKNSVFKVETPKHFSENKKTLTDS